jgi:hypothetical protein
MAEPVTSGRPRALAKKPVLAVEPSPGGDGWSVSARNLGPDLVASPRAQVELLLSVKIVDTGAPHDQDLPDISGDLEVWDSEVRFVPDLPFEPGVRYRAILDLGALGQRGLTEVLTCEFSLPKEAPPAEPEVTQVFPSCDVLPENLLRLYVRFSNPMRRRRAEDNIEILGPDGRPAPDVLYRAPVELWDRSMTCLTILLDPGRLKRGVGPNRMLGPPLKARQRYTLAIGSGMIDTYGHPLREGFSKSFIVSEAVREPIAIEEWKIRSPAADSRDPLELTFPTPLDWAQLWEGITIASERGERIGGRVEIDQSETRWRFTPDAPWRAGAHSVRVSPGLEDPCGNTPYGAFDGPFRSADEVALEKAVRSIPFEVEA